MDHDTYYVNIRSQGVAIFLGPTEARLMELAWTKPSLTVKSALFHLGPDTTPAYTTVMTVLNRLVEKGLLLRTRDGRNFVYRAAIDRESFITGRIRQVLNCIKSNFPRTFQELTA